MLSKQEIKKIRSLDLKKFRKEYNLFLAEGEKQVEEISTVFPCQLLVATKDWLSRHPNIHASETIEVTNEELSRISLLKTPKDVLAVFEQPVYDVNSIVLSEQLAIAADGIQDPGNLGTIVRLADWFGIEHVICSTDTADIFNPKTVQATMGAVARVKVHYVSLPEYLSNLSNVPVYGTFLEGENIYTQELSSSGIIVLGNEGQGIRPEVSKYITKRLYIPNYPQGRKTSESLNVAGAGAVICSEFRRRRINVV